MPGHGYRQITAAIASELKDILGIMTESEGKHRQGEYVSAQENEKIDYRRVHSFSQHF